MKKRETLISNPKQGMSRSRSHYLMGENDYTFMLNGQNLDESGNGMTLSNEHSNILASKFKTGFKVVGLEPDIIGGKTYYLLLNPVTGVSEFGTIKNDKKFQQSDDLPTDLDCKDCENTLDLNKPLEDQQQIPHQTYQTLLNDACNKCLSLRIDKPVKMTLKRQNVGSIMMINDDYNIPRFIELDDLEQYKKISTDPCREDDDKDTCLDCEKLRVFKLYQFPDLKSYDRVVGGKLKKGLYEVVFAYCDGVGEELSSYTSLTTGISIFDNEDIQVDSQEETNFALRFKLENIDKRFENYKIAVIYSTAKTITSTSKVTFVQGVYPTSNNFFTISDNLGEGGIDLTKIIVPKISVKSAKGQTQSNGILFQYGIKREEEINLQPVVNLMGLGLKWQSSVAKEAIYEKPVGNSFKGYNRDEVGMWAFQPISSDGYQYPIYPLVGRPARTDEKAVVNNTDSQSLNDITDSCNDNTRTQRWQFYSTAKKEGRCSVANIPTVSIKEQVNTSTTTKLPNSVSSSVMNLQIPEEYPYLNLKTFIEDFKDSVCVGNKNNLNPLCNILNRESYNAYMTLPDSVDDAVCQGYVEVSSDISVESVNNEKTFYTYKGIDEMDSIPSPKNTYIYTSNGSPDWDFSFSIVYNSTFSDGRVVPKSFERVEYYSNLNCQNSQPLQYIQEGFLGNYSDIGFFSSNVGEFTLDAMKTQISVPASAQQGDTNNGYFSEKIQKGGLWFTAEVKNRELFYINISRRGNCLVGAKTYAIEGSNNNVTVKYGGGDKVRVSIIDKCNVTTVIKSEIVEITDDTYLTINSDIIDQLSFDNFYVVIDFPIIQATGYGLDWDELVSKDTNDTHYIAPQQPTVSTYILDHPCGAFGIVERDREIKEVNVLFDSISLTKKQNWINNCTFQVPKVEECEPQPYEFGELGYFESTEKYPCNKELYDSSSLDIDASDLKHVEFKTSFENNYILSKNKGKYVLSEEADMRDKSIRMFKMPDNRVSPFMSNYGGADTLIYPLGVKLDNQIVSDLLDVAVKNNLLSKDKRDNITGYKIYRADGTLDRSIEASGLLFDMKKVKRDDKDYIFSNFPYNSFGGDKLFEGVESLKKENYLFSAAIPEADYFKLDIPSELSIQGYQKGQSRGYFDKVGKHEEMVILGRKAEKLASTLAVIETLAEITLNLTQGAEVYRIQVGVANSANPVGIGFHIAATILNTVQAAVFNVARYRYQWLKTFKDLGKPENFGYYYSSVADLSTLETSYIEEGNMLRGISTGKTMKPGILNTVDKGDDEGEILLINNKDRERSTFISTSKDYPLVHPDQYINYDNNDTAPFFSSQPIASEAGTCKEGLSAEFNRRVSIAYVAFKNYVANQYGSLNSIGWIDTHYKGDLSKDNDCDTILGGDTFISRHSIKRKLPIFTSNAFGESDNKPINYSSLSNISEAKYYIDFEATKDNRVGGKFFPEIDYEISTDCGSSNSDFYLKAPSKFYLYYYGQPNFLVETRINTNYRNSKKEPYEQFYPNVQDFMEYTQEDTVSIQRPENFYYSGVYSYGGTKFNNYVLGENWSKEVSLKQSSNKNSVIYSKQDLNENSITEPWLVYKPNDQYVFPSEYGKLMALKGIENNSVLGVFDNQTIIYNAIDTYIDGLADSNRELGTGGIFAKRPKTFSNSDLGYIASQSSQIVSTEFGHFIVDTTRGQVFFIKAGGQGFEEISRYSGGKPNGMDVWFKEHLPFKMSKYYEVDTDNPYNGIGMTMGWDSKFRRLFLTKKDYTPKKEAEFFAGKFYDSADVTISKYEALGYTYVSRENNSLKFTKPKVIEISNTTDIHIFYDTSGSFGAVGEPCLQQISDAIDSWITNYRLENPLWEGQLYEYTDSSERWLNYASLIKTTTYQGQDTSDKDILVISFCNESQPSYQNNIYDLSKIDAPTNTFINDYNKFVNIVQPSYKSFIGLHYPIAFGDQSQLCNTLDATRPQSKEFVLNSIAAIKGTKMTEAEADTFSTRNPAFTQVEWNQLKSALTTANPYPNDGLENYGWYGKWNRFADQNSVVITQQQFQNDIDEFLEGSQINELEELYIDLTAIPYSNTEYFKEVSWTATYKPESGAWESYMSFHPNYYVPHTDYFQTGKNSDGGEFGLWSHLLTNRSKQVFYGKKYPWIVEYPTKNDYIGRRLEAVHLWTEAKRMHSEYDFAIDDRITFNKAVIFSDRENSGNLNLIPNNSSVQQLSQYPKTNLDTQDILITQDNKRWKFEYFWNRVKSNRNNQPLWVWDENQIIKTVNQEAVSFYGKNTLEHLSSEQFLIRLTQDKTSQYDMEFKFGINKVTNEII